MMNYDEYNLEINEPLKRLELKIGNEPAFIEYKLRNDILFFIHTEVPVMLKGKGAGNAILQKALQYAKDHHYKIVPICSFVQSYLQKHQQWNDIISPGAQRFIHKQ